VETTLGGVWREGGPSPGFDWAQWAFANDARLELIEPAGPPGFLHRFIDRHGVGVHHVTFKVPSLVEAAARARDAGYDVVGYDDSHPGWKECFLHPKQAQGIVVQLAETGSSAAGSASAEHGGVRLLALRLGARDEGAVRAQWERLLGGVPERGRGTGTLGFRWSESPIAIRVRIEAGVEPGRLALEVAGAPMAVTHGEFGTLFGTPFEAA
jgi:hypothetical protein